jgi:hypothetical protein
MHANKFRACYVAVLVVGSGFLATRCSAQRIVRTADGSIRYERDFLQLFFPELGGKKYWMTIETATPYDEADTGDREFFVDIGDGPKYVDLGCCIGGELNQVPSPPMPGAEEFYKKFGPPVPTPIPCRSPKPPGQKRLNVDALGVIHPFQYLSAVFVFDSQGRLKSFRAQGSAPQGPKTVDEFWDKLQSHPEMTDKEIVAAYKASGAIYGIRDKEKFIGSLPLEKLEQFLGAFKVIRTECDSTGSERMDKLGAYSGCSILMLTSSPTGTSTKYKATFESARGKLLDLYAVPEKNSTQRSKGPN